MASLKKMLLESRRPMQSRLSLSVWRIAIEHVYDPKIRTSLLNQLKARDDEEIAKGGWGTVFKGWQNRPPANPADFVLGLPDELLFATVKFKLADADDSYLARLFLAGGQLSEMQFNKPIELKRQNQEPAWTEVNLNDLLQRGAAEGSQEVVPLQGTLAQWASTYGLSHVGDTLSAEHEKMLLAGLEFQLPPDYLDLLRQANGFKVGQVQIYSLDATQTVEDRGVKYLVVGAGGDDEFLLVKQNWPHLLRVDHEFTKVLDLGASFITAIESLLIRHR